MVRISKLFIMYLRAGLRRIRYDLVREMIVLVCAVLLGATFLYIFNDFVNQQMGRINPELKRVTLLVAGTILVIWVSGWQFGKIRTLRYEKSSITNTAKRLGESRVVLCVASLLSLGFMMLASSALAWAIELQFLYPFSLTDIISWQLVIWLAFFALLATRTRNSRSAQRQIKIDEGRDLISAMIYWRLQQVFRRNRAAQLSLLFAGLCTIGASYFIAQSTPYAALFFMSYLIGFFASLAIFFQLASDIRLAWAERSMGVSHDLIILVYRRLAYLLIAPYLCLYFLAGLWGPVDILKVLQLLAIAFTPAYLAPVLMFQIDARRPVIQILTQFFVGLFIATAIFVHPLGIVLLPGFAYYALASQQGRFYRV